MRLRIIYIDSKTNKTLKEIELDEEETKALYLDIQDIIEFHINCIKQRVRRNIDRIVEKALTPRSKLLNDKDKQALIQLLLKEKILITKARDLPIEIKKLIVKKADLSVLKQDKEES